MKLMKFPLAALWATVLLFFAPSCQFVERETITEIIEIPDFPDIEEEPEFMYGLPISGMLVHADVIKPNQVLSHILSQFNVSYSTIDKLAQISKDVFDVRRMRVGQPYTVIYDTDENAQYLVYEVNPIEYVVYELGNEPQVVKYERETQEVEQVVSGVIYSSLYLTMQENNINPKLGVEMAQIFAWAIDFYRIQKGDKFKVIYNERFVEGEPYDVGRVKAAYFEHSGKEYYAFHFEKDGKGGYYDENAHSMKAAFLQAPVKFSRISSPYQARRMHPVLKRNKPHLGTDYAAAHGTPIVATGDGVIEAASYTSGNGNYVKVRHNGTYTTQYLHMSKFGKGIKKGVRVRQGDVIGYVGSTGLATGPHVCYRFWKNGKQVDPRREKQIPAEPLTKKHLPDYNVVKADLMAKLNSVDYPEENVAISSLE